MTSSIWPKASATRVAQSLEAHSIIALALGGLVYILVLTGTICVFNHELQRWEQPDAPEMATIAPDAAARAAETVFRMEETPTIHLYINFPQPDLPRTVITTDTQAFFADSNGQITGPETFPWTQFLLDLHYYLHLPPVLGLTVVGALGAFLIALSFSGFLAHPRIFRDAFTFRRGEGRVPLTDLHNRLSVWTSPFHLSNALTGAILGLASVLGFAIAAAQFDGDIGAVFSPVFGDDPPAVEGDAPLAEIAAPLAYMRETFPERPATYFILHEPGTAGQHSSVIGKHDDRLIFGEYYQFDADGAYQGNVGISDGTIGQQIIGSVYNVHFGNWGGVGVKLAYLVFGLSLAVIVASGLRIYFTRRREKGRAAPRLEAAWEGVVWGTPVALAATLFAAIAGGIEGAALVRMFWIGMILLTGAACVHADASSVIRSLKLVLAALLFFSLIAYAVQHRDLLFSPASLPVTPVLLFASVALSGIRFRFDRLPLKPFERTPAE
ncbi:MAG: PepSY-associated TM helix domain-containing protein [Pseudomonadota bacterium]